MDGSRRDMQELATVRRQEHKDVGCPPPSPVLLAGVAIYLAKSDPSVMHNKDVQNHTIGMATALNIGLC